MQTVSRIVLCEIWFELVMNYIGKLQGNYKKNFLSVISM